MSIKKPIKYPTSYVPLRPIISHNERLVKPKTTPLAKTMPTEINMPFVNRFDAPNYPDATNWQCVKHDDGCVTIENEKNCVVFSKGDAVKLIAHLNSSRADTFPKPRKVIQVSICSTGNRTGMPFALCDDGSMWYVDLQGRWVRSQDIPQDISD